MSGKLPEKSLRRGCQLGWLYRLVMLDGIAVMFQVLLQYFVLLHDDPLFQYAPLWTPWTLLAFGLVLFLAGLRDEYRL